MTDAGYVGQDFQLPNGLCRVRAIRPTGNIQQHELSADAFGHAPAVSFVAVGDPDSRSRLDKSLRDGRADSGSDAGDQSCFVFETKHDRSFLHWFRRIEPNPALSRMGRVPGRSRASAGNSSPE